MLKAPSKKRSARPKYGLNLIPILDAVFIFIFFLLMSTNFVKIFEIPADIPIISDREPPPKRKPLGLTLQIYPGSLAVSLGVPGRVVKKFKRSQAGVYDLEGLHNYLINLKRQHLKKNTIIFEVNANIPYGELVSIMDSVRNFRATDPSFYTKDKSGIDKKVTKLFDNIVMGNIGS